MKSGFEIWHPFTNRALDPAPLLVKRAEGVYLHTADGRKIIDAISSWWVNLHGHANPRIAAAVAEQARKLEHVILAGFTQEAAEELATRLGRWVPGELRHLFFSDDGSTAVEVALKLAVQHFRNMARPEKCEIVALAHGYHGDTAGAMSVSDESPFTEPFRAMRYPVHRVHSAYCYRCPLGLKRETCHIECVQQLEGLLESRGEQIAALIVEPLLQGAGGMIVHPVEFLQKVRALSTRHDVLLIADEVLTGFGRTGKMFACECKHFITAIPTPGMHWPVPPRTPASRSSRTNRCLTASERLRVSIPSGWPGSGECIRWAKCGKSGRWERLNWLRKMRAIFRHCGRSCTAFSWNAECS